MVETDTPSQPQNVWVTSMEVNLCHRILKIKSHWTLSTEYLCIEITYLDLNWTPIQLYFSMLKIQNQRFNVKNFKWLRWLRWNSNPDTLFQCINIQCLEFNGFLFSKSDGTDLLPYTSPSSCLTDHTSLSLVTQILPWTLPEPLSNFSQPDNSRHSHVC